MGHHQTCPTGTFPPVLTTTSVKNTTMQFVLILMTKTGLSSLMTTNQRKKLQSLEVVLVISVNSSATLRIKEVDSVSAVLKSGDEESRRAKFFLLAWVPEEGANKLPIMVKGNMSVHKASFKEIFRDFNSEFTFGSEEDLNAEAVMNTIIKAGGANYMGQQA